MENNIEVHPAADIFPAMSVSEFSNLCNSMRENGQREPIWLYKNEIIDGRHRYQACQKLEIEPFFLDWGGKESDILSFVIDVNLHRRHLNESQRAMVAAKLATLENGRRPTSIDVGVTQLEAAKMLNVSLPSLQRAKQVQQDATPELAEKVSSGDVAVSTAAIVSRLPVEEQKEIVAKGEKEILLVAKAIRAKKAATRKARVDPDTPVESNRQRTVTAWQSLVEKMGIFLISARTEATIELAVDNLNERERSSFFLQATRLRDNLNQWIEILEKRGIKTYE